MSDGDACGACGRRLVTGDAVWYSDETGTLCGECSRSLNRRAEAASLNAITPMQWQALRRMAEQELAHTRFWQGRERRYWQAMIRVCDKRLTA